MGPSGEGWLNGAVRQEPGFAAMKSGDWAVQAFVAPRLLMLPMWEYSDPSKSGIPWVSINTTWSSNHRPGCLKRKNIP